jgi:hypothetical protein
VGDLLGVDPARFLRPVPEPLVREHPNGARATGAAA